MKTANKIILPITLNVIIVLSCTICILFTSKVHTIFKLIEADAISNYGYYKYPPIYIIGYTFSILVLLTSLISLIIHYTNIKNKHIIQYVLLYVNIVCLIISAITLAIVHFNFLNYFTPEGYADNLLHYSDSETPLLESIFLEKIFIWLFIESSVSIFFGYLTKSYAQTNDDKNDVNTNITTNNPLKSQLSREIEEMKAQLELQELKNEYMDLYKKLNSDKEK